MDAEKILVWLCSPMGDATLATPALSALRKRFGSSTIFFHAGKTVRELLSPACFNDRWLEPNSADFISVIKSIRREKFSRAILLKNSFGSALSVFLAGVPERIGYARDGRSFVLTGRICPLKNRDGSFRPAPMIDYYLKIAEFLGCDTADRQIRLPLADNDIKAAASKLPAAFSSSPLVILVPGGMFGPSKCWSPQRFARTADWLAEKYNASVVVSVAPNAQERKIAGLITASAKHKPFSLADTPLTLGQLKAVFAKADLVITNDTGPRHIAIAFGRNVITLFGPNNPGWTQTGFDGEIQIVGTGHCVPCEKPHCRQNEHICMDSITVEQVCSEAEKILDRQTK